MSFWELAEACLFGDSFLILLLLFSAEERKCSTAYSLSLFKLLFTKSIFLIEGSLLFSAIKFSVGFLGLVCVEIDFSLYSIFSFEGSLFKLTFWFSKLSWIGFKESSARLGVNSFSKI